MNGIVKVPMQFAILLIGALLFAFYSFQAAPVYFNENAYQKLKEHKPATVAVIEQEYEQLHKKHEQQSLAIAQSRNINNEQLPVLVDEFKQTQKEIKTLHENVKEEINKSKLSLDTNDTNYVFLYFVKHNLPKGLVGLLFAVIFLASWGSISAALNSLASSSLIDVHLLNKKEAISPAKQLLYGRLHTLFWGIFSICVAMFATQMGSLIEAVNILGSLFYGTILGIFLVAFYVKKTSGTSVFTAAILTEIAVIVIYKLEIISFLWLNVIGALLVIIICLLLNIISPKKVYSN